MNIQNIVALVFGLIVGGFVFDVYTPTQLATATHSGTDSQIVDYALTHEPLYARVTNVTVAAFDTFAFGASCSRSNGSTCAGFSFAQYSQFRNANAHSVIQPGAPGCVDGSLTDLCMRTDPNDSTLTISWGPENVQRVAPRSGNQTVYWSLGIVWKDALNVTQEFHSLTWVETPNATAAAVDDTNVNVTVESPSVIRDATGLTVIEWLGLLALAYVPYVVRIGKDSKATMFIGLYSLIGGAILLAVALATSVRLWPVLVGAGMISMLYGVFVFAQSWRD